MDQEDLDQRSHVVFKVDELISEQMSKTLEILKKEAIKFDKIDKDRRKSGRRLKEAEKESGDSGSEDQDLVKRER